MVKVRYVCSFSALKLVNEKAKCRLNEWMLNEKANWKGPCFTIISFWNPVLFVRSITVYLSCESVLAYWSMLLMKAC